MHNSSLIFFLTKYTLKIHEINLRDLDKGSEFLIKLIATIRGVIRLDVSNTVIEPNLPATVFASTIKQCCQSGPFLPDYRSDFRNL
jgi:hypothetical protein